MYRESTSITSLLSKLNGVIVAGPDRWYARCPAHDDKTPSLSIRQAPDKILLHCFAGCQPEQILAAIGLTWRDLYADTWQAGAAAATLSRPRDWPAPGVDLDHERLILTIGAGDLRRGRTLSLEDRARLALAAERTALDHG